MIRIKRPPEMPRYLESSSIRKARLDAASWGELQVARRNMGTARQPFRFPPDLLQHRDVRNALAAAFNRKCAFCETPLHGSRLPNLGAHVAFPVGQNAIARPFPCAGRGRRPGRNASRQAPPVTVGATGDRAAVTVPSTYGAVYVRSAP